MLRFTRFYIGMNPPITPVKEVPELRKVRNDPEKPRVNHGKVVVVPRKPVAIKE